MSPKLRTGNTLSSSQIMDLLDFFGAPRAAARSAALGPVQALTSRQILPEPLSVTLHQIAYAI